MRHEVVCKNCGYQMEMKINRTSYDGRPLIAMFIDNETYQLKLNCPKCNITLTPEKVKYADNRSE